MRTESDDARSNIFPQDRKEHADNTDAAAADSYTADADTGADADADADALIVQY